MPVQKEWKKLFDLHAFALDEMEEREKVSFYYDEIGKPVHFGSVRALCHEKHSELQLEYFLNPKAE